MALDGLNVTPWRYEMRDRPASIATLPTWVRDLVSRYRWRFEPAWSRIQGEFGVRLRDLVLNVPAGSEVDVACEPTREGEIHAWDWRTLSLVKRNGPGFCLSRYRYVYREPSGAWGLWLPVGGALRYFGAFGDEDEAAIAANRLGPKWCREVFRVERVERRGARHDVVPPTRPPVAPTANGAREARFWIEWADGTVEMIYPADL